MEVNQQVWLRRDSSHWGWVPAVIVRKEEETLDNNNNNTNNNNQADEESAVFIHLVNDHSLSLTDDERHYFEDEKEFQVIIKVDKEQLKSAAHEDIKLRNINSLDTIGGGNNSSSPTTKDKKNGNDESSSIVVVGGVDDLIGLTHLHEPAILHALRLRYDSDIIYTSTGPILIAVNPFKPMPKLYQRNAMDLYRIQGENSMKAKSDQLQQITPMKSRNRYNNTPRQQYNAKKGNKTAKETRLSPHVYQTADDAYRQMLRGLETQKMMKNGNPKKTPRRGESRIEDTTNPVDQSILVSGESGAGKTVTTKIVLDYFAMLSKKCTTTTTTTDNNNNTTSTTTTINPTPRKSWGGSVNNAASPRKSWGVNSNNSNQEKDVSIEQQVLQSNPILEAFGNARTIRNDNSSRFGKYIDIAFDQHGKLIGASIETYLLEKVRLIHPAEKERNYHIFYQFLSSATAQQRQEFFLTTKTAIDLNSLNLN